MDVPNRIGDFKWCINFVFNCRLVIRFQVMGGSINKQIIWKARCHEGWGSPCISLYIRALSSFQFQVSQPFALQNYIIMVHHMQLNL